MKCRNVTSVRIGRKTNLALALALALALGGTTTVVANPGSMDQTQHTSAAEQQAQQALAARQAQDAADAVLANAQPMGTTRYVANCDDTGGGSLRDTVATANDGDTIDMTAMLCNVINLNTALVVSQNNLGLVGKFYAYPFEGSWPDTFIRGNARAIDHTGTGTLTLQDINLSGGHITASNGACIRSAGSVKLDDSHVHDCIVKRPAGSSTDVMGGAIYAAGQVTLSGSIGWFNHGSSWVYGNVASAANGNVYGGGIYAGGWVRIGAHSEVFGNLAESITGNANGGGIYGKDWVDLTTYLSTAYSNKAETHGALTMIKGAGIYTEKGSLIHGLVTDNEANYVVADGTSIYFGQGTGIFAESGVETFPGASINDNHGNNSIGGGIYTKGYLKLEKTTVADNSARGAAAMFVKGDVNIRSSTLSGNWSRVSANIQLGSAATGDLRISSSTISNNAITGASTNGAALNLQHGTLITNSTITGNVEKNATDTKYGAGISLDSNVNVQLLGTIVGRNALKKTDGSSKYGSDIEAAKDTSGATITGNHNLIQWSNISLPADTIIAGPALGPLADNGGLTKTHEPCRNSPAINNGSANTWIHDQRGADFPRLMGLGVEIGAIEAPEYSDIIFRNGFEKGACSS